MTLTRSLLLQRLMELNLTLPKPTQAIASYQPVIRSHQYLYISGQLPFLQGALLKPHFYATSNTLDEAVYLAQICGLNIIAQIDQALSGNWASFQAMVKLTVFVQSGPDFTQHPTVANGVSNLLGTVLSPYGTHARSAVGVSSLPLGAGVEAEAIVALNP